MDTEDDHGLVPPPPLNQEVALVHSYYSDDDLDEERKRTKRKRANERTTMRHSRLGSRTIETSLQTKRLCTS